ncbi:MAG: DoxX family membrane protein [Bacteroidales bacterium]|nr:DoxX family membrane protein [Bacteroidales bacterium]
MKKTLQYSNAQLSMLVVLRVSIGWHFLYEGFVKLLNPNWSSVGYLLDSEGFLSGFFETIASDPNSLAVADFLNMWGLIAIGLGLMLGCLSRIAIISGITLLAFYYLSHPPFIGFKYAMPTEGSYLIVNKILIELFALVVLYLFPSSRQIGFDRLIFGPKS